MIAAPIALFVTVSVPEISAGDTAWLLVAAAKEADA